MTSTTEDCANDLDFVFAVDWEYALQSYHLSACGELLSLLALSCFWV